MNPYLYELQLMHNFAKVASLSLLQKYVLAIKSWLSFLPAPRHFVIEKINKFFSPCPEHYYTQSLQNFNCKMLNLCNLNYNTTLIREFLVLPLSYVSQYLILILLRAYQISLADNRPTGSVVLYSFYIRLQVQNIAGNVIFRSDSLGIQYLLIVHRNVLVNESSVSKGIINARHWVLSYSLRSNFSLIGCNWLRLRYTQFYKY